MAEVIFNANLLTGGRMGTVQKELSHHFRSTHGDRSRCGNHPM
jgi:hypothetical protein